MSTEPTTTIEGQENQEVETSQDPGNSIADISDLLGMEEVDEEQPELGADGQPVVKTPAVPPLDKTATDGKPGEEKNPLAAEPVKTEPKPGEVDSDLKKLLTEVLAERKPAEPEKPAEPKPEEYKPKYMPNIPDPIMSALEHEDPAVRKQGMAAMIGGAMNRVYEDLRKEFQTELTTFQTKVPTIMAQRETATKAAEDMRTDFYGSFPEFGETPKQRQFVAMVAMQLAQAQGKEYKGYNPDFKAKLEAEVRALTGIQPKAPAPKAPAGKKPGAPAIPAKATTRAPADGQQSLSDEIADVISWN